MQLLDANKNLVYSGDSVKEAADVIARTLLGDSAIQSQIDKKVRKELSKIHTPPNIHENK